MTVEETEASVDVVFPALAGSDGMGEELR